MKFNYKGENILNIPNLLSLYRLLMVPVILGFAIARQETLFAVFICISLVTDILDGFIARNFNMRTRFGSGLDNLADIGTIFTALYGLFVFKWDEVSQYAWLLYLFFSVFILSYLVAFFRFQKIPGLHLYLSVFSGYLQGIFLFLLFAWGFIPWLFYLAMLIGTIAYIEKILVLLKLDDIRPGVKGLYWLLKKQNTT